MICMSNKKLIIIGFAVVGLCVSALYATQFRQSEPLHILQLSWGPADAFYTVAKGFTEETGIPLEIDEISIQDMQTVMYRDLDSKHPKYDLLTIDTQWLGRNVERGKRLTDLTNFVDKYNLTERFFSFSGYSEYPPAGEKYYAVPFAGHTLLLAYRKDLFEDSQNKRLFAEQYGYELTPPETWGQVRDIAEFFYRPESNLYGISLPTDEAYDMVTMGLESVFFSYGAEYGDMVTREVEGYINSSNATAALAQYKELYSFSPQAAGWNGQYSALPVDYVEGRSAMVFDFVPYMYDMFDVDKNPYFEDTGYVTSPAGPAGRYSALAGISFAVEYNSPHKSEAKKFLEWWTRPETQQSFMRAGGLSLEKSALDMPEFTKRPYAAALQEGFAVLKDYWTVPEYGELLSAEQEVLSAYLLDETQTAKEALDILKKRWEVTFKTSPYNMLR